MKIEMNNLNGIAWFLLSADGFLIDLVKGKIALENKSAVYIYQYLDDETVYYIGSAVNLSQRFRQHRYRVSRSVKSCPFFYNYVSKYGWNKFRFGILEYVNSNQDLVNREQFYLDLLKPTLNINKTAGSMLGFKHSDLNRIKFSMFRKGKSFKQNAVIQRNFRVVSLETRDLLKERSRGASVIVLDKENRVVNRFNTIKETASYYGLSSSSISKYLKSGKYWRNIYNFTFNLNKSRVYEKGNIVNKVIKSTTVNINKDIDKKGYSVEILDKNKTTLFKYNSIRFASRHLFINRDTILKYNALNKLWNDKYYFVIYRK